MSPLMKGFLIGIIATLLIEHPATLVHICNAINQAIGGH